MRALAMIATAAVLGLAACGGDETEGSEEPQTTEAMQAAPLRTFEIVATEFKLEPSRIRIERPGTYRFRIVNRGQTAHALEVESEHLEEETETVGPGESAELTIDLHEGDYELYCPVGDHKDRGMDGSVVVGAGAGTRTTETGEDSGRDEGGTDY
jgi:uncharacterized cupredoxin-like copper-binding protein